jgi:hypothetical protein
MSQSSNNERRDISAKNPTKTQCNTALEFRRRERKKVVKKIINERRIRSSGSSLSFCPLSFPLFSHCAFRVNVAPTSSLRATPLHLQIVRRTISNLYAVPITICTTLHPERLFHSPVCSLGRCVRLWLMKLMGRWWNCCSDWWILMCSYCKKY